MEVDLIYCAAALPFVSLALRSWAHWARGAGGRRYLLLGAVLGAFGVDGLRLILHKMTMLPPVWWAEPVILMLIGGFLFYALLRAWKSLERPVQRPRRLEDLLEEAAVEPTGSESV